jgi:hypothetical protein
MAIARHAHMSDRDVREAARWSKMKIAAFAHVGMGTVTLFEANPDAVADPERRATLRAVYDDLRQLVA